jgi:CelD/BcsL family acetyltransferase involved in cellulose biosynthesis
MDVSFGPITDVQALAARWRDLEDRADASFFQSWTWIGSWLKSLPDLAALRALAVQDAGTTVGLCVIGRRYARRHGVFGVRGLFCNETGDPELDTLTVEHSGVLMQRGMERPVLDTVARFFRVLTPPWDELRIAGIESRSAGHHVEAFVAAGFEGVKKVDRPYFVVRLAGLREQGHDYLSALSANTRSQLRRSLRGYEQRGPVTMRMAANEAEAHEYLARLREWHQSYWSARGKPGAFATPFANTFHRNLIAVGMPRGEIQLVSLACGDEPIGYLYNFRHRGVVANYQSGLSYGGDSRLKPGLTAHHLAIENSLRMGDSTYDFLMGDQRYKANLSTEEGRMSYLTVQQSRIRFRLEDAARAVVQRLRRRGGSP